MKKNMLVPVRAVSSIGSIGSIEAYRVSLRAEGFTRVALHSNYYHYWRLLALIVRSEYKDKLFILLRSINNIFIYSSPGKLHFASSQCNLSGCYERTYVNLKNALFKNRVIFLSVKVFAQILRP